jgi:hypothetical protein
MSIILNKQFTDAPGLSQQQFVTDKAEKKPLVSEGQFRPTVFSRTFQASRTGEILVEVGTGKVEPINHSRIILQLSKDEGVPVSELVDSYKQLVYRLSYEPEIIRRIVALALGSSERPIRANNIPKLPASAFIDHMMGIMFPGVVSRVDEVLLHIAADALIAMVAQVGLVSNDAPHIHRMRPGNLFPAYDDLIDIMELRDVTFISTQLGSADLSLVSKTLNNSSNRDGGAISPSILAQHIQNAFVGAYEASKGSYASHDIVNSVLATLHRVWSPMTPTELMPKERVLNSPFMSEFQSNLALFLATQDMVAHHPMANKVSFTDEEMTSFVFQLFSETVSLISPYDIRPLSDAVDFYGMKSSRDHNGEPGHIFLYEDWKVQDHVEAFMPIRQTLNGTGRFLLDMPTASAALANALGPIQKVVSLSDAIDVRVDSYNMQDQTKRASDPLEIHIGFPSLEVREAQLEVQYLNALEPYIFGATEPTDAELKKIGITRSELKSIKFDYYSSLMHLAVARGSRVSIGEIKSVVRDGENATMGPLYILWSIRTTFTRQRGLSALLHGEVETTEPLEVIAYLQDFTPATSLSVNYPRLSDHEGAIHLWKWHKYSSKLSLQAPFEITLRNKRYKVSIDEHEMLSLGARRNEVRFMNQYDTKALVRIALKSMMDDYKFVVSKAKNSKDELVKEAYKGREIQSVLRLVAMLSSIASAGAGQRTITYAKQRIADAMYGQTGTLDGYDEIHVGVQNHRLKVWAGIRVLELLQLISGEEAAQLADMIRESNALAYALSTVDLSSYK